MNWPINNSLIFVVEINSDQYLQCMDRWCTSRYQNQISA